MRRFLKQSLAAAALVACSFAQADAITFEEPTATGPFVFEGDHIEVGKYWIEAYSGSGTPGAWVGSLIDGAALADTCEAGMLCPTNNSSTFYAALADSFFYFGRNDDKAFKLRSFQASFMGFEGLSYPVVSGLLILAGYNANGQIIATSSQLPLFGPTNGQFGFSEYDAADFGATFANTAFSYIRVLGYACNAAGSCSRANNQSNFAIDDIAEVPEPATWALAALALIAAGATTRRRSV